MVHVGELTLEIPHFFILKKQTLNLVNREKDSISARMLLRLAQNSIASLIRNFPVVAILGPRQVGKTTLAQEIAKQLDQIGLSGIYLDLEAEEDRAKLSEPTLYLRQHADKLVILDEIHRRPEMFGTLRGLIDENRRVGRRAGQFIILGSASLDLLRQSGETLAGRIAYVELYPFNLQEVMEPARESRNDDVASTLWLRGGFPDSFLAPSDDASLIWRRNFIRTYLQRDIPQFGPRIAEDTLRRFWTMLAHLHGNLSNAASLARSLGVDAKTVANYLDLMVDLLLVRRLEPWAAHTGKRLVRSPKVYVRDTGLMHALLQIRDHEALLGHPQAGDSWEGFVIENILAVAPADAEACFYRTSAGAEIDLVLKLPGETWAIEIKRSLSPHVSRGFHLACDDVQPQRRILVYPGQETYPGKNGLEVMGLAQVMTKLILFSSFGRSGNEEFDFE